ncbi:DNA polymerase III subunit beta [Candidatus Dojkabacteria bacterium]|uniref:Beta sliding clamp n=1 Tax=Candidatus Dojkabacteria bacterium TaxID=2099670 RepID=A0A955L412_9BACT|nr:DNA polymerase III subunit beta [Candidatus Dojkabacteria bacterium]
MKFTVLQENLSKAINIASKAVSTKPGLPVLSNILIEAIDNKVEFSSTDLELGIITWIPAEIEVPGKITVSARTLSDFINSLGSGKLSLYMEGTVLKVKGANSHANFNVIPADEFPEIPHDLDKQIFSVNALTFCTALDKVVFAAALDDTRPILTGILFEAKEDGLSLVGVDGFRLSKTKLNVEHIDSKFNEVIPAKALNEISKVAKEADESDVIELYSIKGNNQVVFKFRESTFVSRLIDGEFPEYRDILPESKVLELSFNKEKFNDAIKIINIFARNIVGNKTIFNIDTLDSKLTMSASLAEVGSDEVTLEVEGVKGTDMQIGYSAKYLADMAASMDGEIITFETNGSTAPGKFFSPDNENYFHIIMPMRLD